MDKLLRAALVFLAVAGLTVGPWTSVSGGLNAWAASPPPSVDVLIVPGKSVGQVSIGMTPAQVAEALGKPEREEPGMWVE